MSISDQFIEDTFVPNNYIKCVQEHDVYSKFNTLHQISIDKSNIDNTNTNKHLISYSQSLNAQQVDQAFLLSEEKLGFIFDNDVMEFIESIITDEIDKSIKRYFGCEYAIMFYAHRTINSDTSSNNPSTKWHCDNSPTQSLMLMCYLNGEEDHNSSTLFLNEDTTKKLKEIGYIYNRVEDRLTDISSILEHYNLKNEIHRHNFKPGESIIFAATELAHRAELPKQGASRTSFDICLIPSPVTWKEAIKLGYIPANEPISFKGQPQRLLQATGLSLSEEIDEGVIRIGGNGSIVNDESLIFHLNSIFKDSDFANKVYEDLHKNPINYNILTISELIILLKKSFQAGLKWDQGFNQTDICRLSDLIKYEKDCLTALTCFATDGKPNPEAVMWPIPDHAKHPRNKFNMLPFVETHKIMDKSTPIGSAGSCFAVEIAQVLQKENFNYVITELGDNPQEEAIIDGYTVGSGEAMYSANFGILFNTPSLRQIAEKAFKEREFNKYLIDAENGFYMDPYRENVYFGTEKAFLKDYPKHIEAIKQSLLQSDVFIFTAGLNECWQLKDGTVISRNPRNGLHHLIEHRVLTVEENINNIITFFNITKRHNPNFKLILTLSPVPLLATGRADHHHIIEANTHSKAILRVAIEEAVKSHPDIYYLPSYELVTECMPNPWKADHRHVTPETVSKVIDMFKKMFVYG